jgi:hypothetical protein
VHLINSSVWHLTFPIVSSYCHDFPRTRLWRVLEKSRQYKDWWGIAYIEGNSSLKVERLRPPSTAAIHPVGWYKEKVVSIVENSKATMIRRAMRVGRSFPATPSMRDNLVLMHNSVSWREYCSPQKIGWRKDYVVGTSIHGLRYIAVDPLKIYTPLIKGGEASTRREIGM